MPSSTENRRTSFWARKDQTSPQSLGSAKDTGQQQKLNSAKEVEQSTVEIWVTMSLVENNSCRFQRRPADGDHLFLSSFRLKILQASGLEWLDRVALTLLGGKSVFPFGSVDEIDTYRECNGWRRITNKC